MERTQNLGQWHGTGSLYDHEKLIAQVRYTVNVSQVLLSEVPSLGEVPGVYKTRGVFTILDCATDIQNGAELLLEMQDGRKVAIRVVSYQFGEGTFQLENKGLKDLGMNE